MLWVAARTPETHLIHTLNISLPDELVRFVDAQIAGGRYSSAIDYVIALIRADKNNEAAAARETNLTGGLQDDAAPPMSGADWGHVSPDALERIAARHADQT